MLRCLYNLFVLFLLLLSLSFFLFINLMSFKGIKKKEPVNKTLLILKSKSQNTIKVPFFKSRDDSILPISFLLILCINLNVAVNNLPILDQKMLIAL
ncbi:hypothetical protein BHT95_19845 [Bacillus paralicheniformis]|nr:hypothetical protein BHT95_19845 [Bacillus paralicheniformis]